MGNQDDGTGIMQQGILKNLLGLDVQVIGRFIQDQAIAVLEQDLDQGQAAFFASGKDGDRFVDIVARKRNAPSKLRFSRSLARLSTSWTSCQTVLPYVKLCWLSWEKKAGLTW